MALNPKRGFRAILIGYDARVSLPVNHPVAPRILNPSAWIVAAGIFLTGALVRIGILGVFARANDDDFLGLLTKWDAQYYLAIAEFGYFDADLGTTEPVHERTLAFFPGFSYLVRVVHQVTGLDYVVSSIVLNTGAGIVLTAGAMALAARMGANRVASAGAGILVSAAPMSITFSMPYSEALFGALSLWALVALLDRRWWLAGLLIFLCGGIRLTAVALIGVFFLVVVFKARRNWKAWTALALTPWLLAGYVLWASLHTWRVGGYFGIQEKGWHSGFDFGIATARWMWTVMTTSREAGYLLSVAVIVASLCALILGFRRLPLAVWLFSATVMATVLLSDGIMHSRPRLLLPAVILLLPWVIRISTRVPRGWQILVAAGWVLFGGWFSAYMLAVFPWAI